MNTVLWGSLFGEGIVNALADRGEERIKRAQPEVLVANLSDYLLKSNMASVFVCNAWHGFFWLLRYTIIVINLISEIVVVSSFFASLSLLLSV